LSAGCAGGWFTTVLPGLAPSGRRWTSEGRASSCWVRELAEQADFFASGIILDRKTRSEAHSNIRLYRAMASEGATEGAAVGAAVAVGASCRLGLSPLATLAQVGTVCEGGALGGGAKSAVASRHAGLTSLQPQRGRRECGAGGGVPLPALARLDPSTP
jgi:hypothetical protein